MTPSTGPGQSAELLVSLAADLAEGRQPDPGAAQAFAAAVGRWIEDDEPLEVALGLRGGPGDETARTQWRRAKRDAALRSAHGLMEGGSAYSRTVALDLELHVFETRVWPAWRIEGGPPENCSELRRHLWVARRFGTFPKLSRLSTICSRY